MLVVNLFGPPGCGKSTGAAYIFAKLKLAGINAELVTEVAKDLTYERHNVAFRNQLYVLGQQAYRISRLEDKVDVVITDSPIIHQLIYNESPHLRDGFTTCVLNEFNKYRNRNYFLINEQPYIQLGRAQTEEEARELGTRLAVLLAENGILCKRVVANEEMFNIIAREIIEEVRLIGMS